MIECGRDIEKHRYPSFLGLFSLSEKMTMRVNRRTFLKQATICGMMLSSNAVLTTSCSMTLPQPVSIDVHHHIVPPVYKSALAKIGITSFGGIAFPDWNVSLHHDPFHIDLLFASMAPKNSGKNKRVLSFKRFNSTYCIS